MPWPVKLGRAESDSPRHVRRASVIAIAVVYANGGECSGVTDQLMLQCRVAVGHGFFNGGTTYGNVFVSAKSPRQISASTMRHENIHASQWAGAGGQIGFPILYFGASGFSWLQTGNYGCGNFFEWQAGFEDGDYPC